MDKKSLKNQYLLIGGQFISQIGGKFYALALAFWVLRTTGSASEMGLVLFFSLAPSVLLGFFAGGFIDRFDRKTILVACDIFRGGVIGTVVLAYYSGLMNLAVIITAQVLLSIASALFNPTVQAVIPQIADSEHIAAVNTRSQLASGIATVIGPVLGGLAVSYLGYTFVFIFNALSFLAAALLESLLNLEVLPVRSFKKETVAKNIAEGYKYIFHRKSILVIVAVIAVVHFFAGSIQVIMPVFANRLGGNGARNLGYIETFFGMGAVASALLLNLLGMNRREDGLMFGGIAGLGLVLCVFGVLEASGFMSILPFLLMFTLMSSAVIVISTSYQVIMQKNVDKKVAGRVFSIAGSVGNLMLPASMLLFGYLVDRFRIYQLTVACGASIVGIATLLYVIYVIYGRKAKKVVYCEQEGLG